MIIHLLVTPDRKLPSYKVEHRGICAFVEPANFPPRWEILFDHDENSWGIVGDGKGFIYPEKCIDDLIPIIKSAMEKEWQNRIDYLRKSIELDTKTLARCLDFKKCPQCGFESINTTCPDCVVPMNFNF